MLNIIQKEFLKLALPILLTQLFLVLVPVTDTIYAGHYSTTLLAGISIGSSIYVTTYVVLMGIIQVFNTLFSNAHGAKKINDIQNLHGQAYLLITILSLLGIVGLGQHPFWLFLTKKNPELQKLLIPYLEIMSLALPASLFIRFGTTYLNTLRKPWHALMISFLYFSLKVLITFLFLDKTKNNMEAIKNCALSSVFTNWITTLTLFSFIHKNPDLMPYRPTWPKTLYCCKTIKKILTLGIPNAMVYCTQSASSYIINLLIIPLGIKQIGAHQIGSNLVSIIYMCSISLSSTTTILVAHKKGALEYCSIHQARKISLRTALFCGLIIALLLTHCTSKIIHLFTNSQDIEKIAKPLIEITSLFQIADWIGVSQYALLKGLEQTFWPMIIYSICLWGIGIGLGFVLTFSSFFKHIALPYQGVHIFWLSSTCGLLICNLLLHICYRIEMRKLYAIPKNKTIQETSKPL